MNNFSPVANYNLSPYTGWTRAHWVAMLSRFTYGYVRAAERHGSPARALFPGDLCYRPDAVDALEAFARLAPAWAAWLRNPANPVTLHYKDRELDLAALLRQALLDGTNPANPYTYWGNIGHLDQRLVETADIALALWLSREQLFEQLTPAERRQIIDWLSQVDGKETYPDNWILFPALVEAVRLRLGYPAPEATLNARLAQAGAFYRGDGWYADGEGQAFDLYNPWMFGWHYLMLAWIDGERRPDHYRIVLDRARSLLAGFQYFFGANGAYPAWGRSLVYRFSAVSTFTTGYWLGIAPGSPGGLRRLCSGCLRYFSDHGMFDPTGDFARQGYHGEAPLVGEGYIAPGSPGWASHALFALTFDQADPFWTETEAPLPVEQADFELALPGPGFLLTGHRDTGQVLLVNSRSGHPDDTARPHFTSKYGKLVYSTHFPFNVLPAGKSYAPDAVLALTADGQTFGHRALTRAGGVAPGCSWAEFEELIKDRPQLIRVAVLIWQEVQLRLAFIQPDLPVRAFESPGALGCAGAAAVTRRSDPAAGWEYAQAEGRAVAIRRLWGYDGQSPSAPFLGYSTLNLAYPYAEQPLVYETRSGAGPRSLAALSLVRPAPFDPARELAGFTVTAPAEGTFQVTFPDGEMAWVALGNEPPASVTVGGIRVEGSGLRCVRIKPEAGEVRGLGLKEVAGIVRLAEPGSLRLSRVDGAVHITTGVGLSLAAGWPGKGQDRLEVRTLAGDWLEVTEPRRPNTIPPALVELWRRRNERQLVDFRLI